MPKSSARKPQERSSGLKFLKAHGQHILKNPLVIKTILDKANIQPTDIILEIGPGSGNMTVQMLQRAKKVIAVEVDPRMVVELRKRVQGKPYERKLEIIHADFLKTDLPFFNMCIANCPYQISSAIVFKLLAHRPMFRCAYLMFQREFALRMVAQPGSQFYCRLSSNCQLLSKCDHVLKVHKNSFRPPPKVDSSIIRMEPLNPPPPVNFKEWDGMNRICFSGKNRKLRALFSSKGHLTTLYNNYKTYCALKNIKFPDDPEFKKNGIKWMKNKVQEVLEQNKLDEERAKKLSNHELLRLLAAFNEKGIHFLS